MHALVGITFNVKWCSRKTCDVVVCAVFVEQQQSSRQCFFDHSCCSNSLFLSLPVFDGLGDLLMPTMVPSGQPVAPTATATVTAAAASKGLGSDLDSSLASLVGSK